MKTLLIVEDNKTLQDLYKALIQSIYPEVIVTSAYDGKEALDKIKNLEYHALISDIVMPGMDGMEFYEVLKEENADLSRRTMFITSSYDNPDCMSFIKREKVPFLGKPFERKDFFCCLDKILFNGENPSGAAAYDNLRTYKRLRAETSCWLKLVDDSSDVNLVIDASLIDYSEGGAGVSYNGRKLDVGQELKAIIDNLNGLCKIAKVVWSGTNQDNFKAGLQWI